ncbi:hypothetical protein [Aurantiacibacter sediminis]|uniref:hypothetical protein n=1 Tax=Aurantiacibacter sediminis TaxID=2793064 RepID=UPI001F2F3E55|nr:hypothetical protein [Aurantiacibacter sediminis]
MPLHLTKIAFGAKSFADIESWYAQHTGPFLTTRYRRAWEGAHRMPSCRLNFSGAQYGSYSEI